MRTQPIAQLPVSRSGVCVVDGYGIKMRVERGRLVVSDSIGPLRRAARFARATHAIRRLVLLGHTGFVTLDAIRWLADVGIGFVQLDPDGRLLIASGGVGLDDPRLRRAQAVAFGKPTGMAVARALLDAKLTGQLRVAASLGASDEVVQAIGRSTSLLRLATTPAELMVPEAAAAAAYWAAWAGIEVRWAKADVRRIPDHWRTIGGRASPLSGNPRLAANPANALLNYLYALLEAEARLACLAMGLDPGLGVLHADQRARDSLALDLMEALRPDVDAHLLDLLDRRTFRRADFLETREGGCRIVAPLTHELAESTTLWRSRVAPIVERVANLFLDSRASALIRLPSKLTQSNRSAGRDGIRRQPLRPGATTSRPARRSCRYCGGPTIGRRRTCEGCATDRRADQMEQIRAIGPAALALRRAKGENPGNTPESNARRGLRVSAHNRSAAEWDRQHRESPDPNAFRRDILPRLVGMTSRELARLLGLSFPYAAAILRGEKVPHPRHWTALSGFIPPITRPR